jgi:hypothetical protein
MELIHSSTSSTNQSKKSEKSEATPKFKNNIKSNEILKDSSKNSYFSKYIEEYNRNKINKKNNSLRQSKHKNDQKDISNLNHQNLSLFSYKKSKNSSLDKTYCNINNNPINYSQNNNIGNLRKVSQFLNKEFTDNKTTENLNIKHHNHDIISMTPRNISQSNEALLGVQNRQKNPTQKKVELNNNKNDSISIAQIPKIENLTNKEKAYLLLSYSKCLRLCERMIFSRSTAKLRENVSKKHILETNRIFLNEKIVELKKKIENCDDKLNNKFNATKTAEMTLNFITANIENEFKLNICEQLGDDTEKKYFYNYAKLIYLLLDENYEQIKNENLVKQLYQKINSKGYQNIKDYLYFIYIKNLKENKNFENIDKINDILKEVPDLLSFKYTFRYDKFISYTCFLFKEIVNFANDKIDTFKLKRDCINFIHIINNIINLYDEKCSKKK